MERGVLPIGDWSIFIILSIFSIPIISLCAPGFSFEPFICFANALYKISFTNVLFPDPETPVTHINCPSGNLTFMFFKLFWVAPFTSIALPFDFLLFSGIGICFFPLKYCPVIDSGICFICSAVPCAITFPPWTPGPGPISIIWSAAYIVSSSCSTTITVFPKSLNFFNVAINFSLSLWWSLCASPPDSVPALLDNVKYSNPTSIKNCNLLFNSFKICSDIILSLLFNFNEFK